MLGRQCADPAQVLGEDDLWRGLSERSRVELIGRGAGIMLIIVRVRDIEIGDLHARLEHLRDIAEALRRRRAETWEAVIRRRRLIGHMIAVEVEDVAETVVDRRRDFAIMKALGASDRLIALFVAGEAAVLAAAGSVLGFAAGIGIASLIGRINFNAPVAPRFAIFPTVLFGSLLVTLIATLLPLRLLHRIHPAMILRGE